ncbi:Putative lipoprotein [Streptomyces venezuelae]|uniref:ABC transporter family substrate-binding protein n=1 Tax=Streptomyces gardneri TaxID=66892 RepID=UPI0006BC1B3B|nr:ABC transporter family substrate-binding protein [Streptomyces gardneri]ALO10826.1 Putative lipoprotein [Streptomyces venezuelae]QPK47787.1 ABC transporter family substrate-binding protein [Streptomyces gardneri]WRK39238.1 ABC transporter family substrate-binding protein [Streptomyces venezuelae]CUM38685.1 Oligopeptide ABC transporter, periplasmic oligopeptide-binding protein OppA (TC 3.A.1.5.1) [Streptomyces venezuelae]
MSQFGAPRGRTCSRSPRSRTLRSVATLTSAVLAVTVLAGCSSDGTEEAPAAAQDNAPASRDKVADGGTLRWAVDALPTTLNSFQADADGTTARIAGAVLPSLYTLDGRGRPQLNPDYLESAQVVETEPKQVVLYKLHQQAVWSDGREIGAPDFVAQWRALSGRDTAYWTARNSGYERIEKIERGKNDLEVRVTFAKPYADWQSLFTPLYPKQVMGSPNAFNDGARTTLKATAGPFLLKSIDRKSGDVTLARNPRWWGQSAKLDSLVLKAVPRADRGAALAADKLDLAEIDRSTAERITLALRDARAGRNGAQAALAHGPGSAIAPSKALKSWALAHGSDEKKAEEVQAARQKNQKAVTRYANEQNGLAGFVVRKSLEPAYTQLSLNGESGALADERVRRAVARAIDRQELAESVLKPLGLPATPPGSHLALAGQAAYADSSDALGDQDTKEARALLADAGWVPGGAVKKPAGAKDGTEAGSEAEKAKEKNKAEGSSTDSKKKADTASDEGLYIVGDDKPGARRALPAPVIGAAGPENGTDILTSAPAAARQSAALLARAEALDTGTGPGRAAHSVTKPDRGVAGAYAPLGTAAPVTAPEASQVLGKDGKALSLRFVLPSGPGSEALRAVGDRIVRMLDAVGIRTQVTKVADDSFFKDHVAAGDYDLALYSWPASAFPATDARPIFAKPEPASDGSLLVEQNYSRVGTDRIDQLFDQAAGTLDEEEARELVRQADARIWAAAGSIPLYQRPQLVAAKAEIVNAGAWGLAAPRYQDIGFKKAESAKGAERNR